jgi:hypothetical protein
MNNKVKMPIKHVEFLQVVGGKAYNIGFHMCKSILTPYVEFASLNDAQLEDALCDGIYVEAIEGVKGEPGSNGNCLYKRVEYYK